MKTKLIESYQNRQRVYNSLLLEPKHLGIFSNELAVKVINELAKQPMCAMDIARKLKQHEQKVYYHLRKMKNAGIVKLNGTEERYGMTARLFELVSPVIATKLYDDGYEVQNTSIKADPKVSDFLEPFIRGGKLNAKIIIGDPYPHGKYDAGGLDSCYVADIAMFLGNFLQEMEFPCYTLDVRVDKEDLKKNNIIVIGGPRGNVITQNLNSSLPIYFDEKNSFYILSKITRKTYTDDQSGIVVVAANPFNKSKKLIFLAGRRTRGTQAAVLAFTKNIDDLIEGSGDGNVARVVHGFDGDGDGMIDSIKFLE